VLLESLFVSFSLTHQGLSPQFGSSLLGSMESSSSSSAVAIRHFPLMMAMIMQQSTQVLPVRAGRVPWAVHALSTHQCAMYYVVLWLGTEKWSSTSGFSKPFYKEAPEPFPCPLLQGNSVGGWRQALPPDLAEP
jgi:hypothetical protein